ncbi:MAG TPA: hypothetical protein VHN11_22930 [Xanthobacteraceae bacterium]|jgi:hypothetical protein|nr:hypothetical protein [Xanthobacteraceae bacterium]
MQDFIPLILIGITFFIAVHNLKRWRRKRRLMEKYKDEVIVNGIMRKMVWQNMTSEQLQDSWGDPADVDRDIYKTRVKETWKYEKTGKNRYRKRVLLEGGEVVGWKVQ